MKPKVDFIRVGDRKTQVTWGGDGPPLLYLHSAGGETEWMPFHEQLAQRFTVFVPAHPGFALSEGLDTIHDIQDLAWHYVDLHRALQLPERMPVVGFSLGAWLALEVAVLRPALFSRLVLTAAAGLHLDEAPIAELFVEDFDELKPLLFYDPQGPNVSLALPDGYDDPRMLMLLRAREATARVGWNPYLHDPKLKQHLHRVEQPALVLWGRHDRLIPLSHGEYYAAHLPAAQLKVFDDCGHMVPFEQPDAFCQEVATFLTEA